MDTSFLKNKTVLVTGGTGTFGKAFVKRMLEERNAKKIIIFSRDEFKQHHMQAEFPDPEKKLRFFLGDIRDRARLERAFEGVDIVVHAAALKHVTAIEYNPLEGILTNITGTQNVIDAALNKGVEKVLLISSDKAVQPINLYGATKFAAEKLMVAANAYRKNDHDTAFSVIRYGNVVGSRGSFIETLQKQRASGTITLTHKDMTRFWIPIDKVMDIVLQSLEHMKGGEIFVPKMKSLPVVEVIKMLVPECKVKVIGMRPGEKLHEVLVTEYEAPRTKNLDFAYVIRSESDATLNLNYNAWLDRKPSMPKSFIFASNSPKFFLSKKEAQEILKI